MSVRMFLRMLLVRMFICYLGCSVCLMGKAIEDRIKKDQIDKEIQDIISSSSEAENEGEKKMPFFLPRKHSVKNYYSDSDCVVC